MKMIAMLSEFGLMFGLTLGAVAFGILFAHWRSQRSHFSRDMRWGKGSRWKRRNRRS